MPVVLLLALAENADAADLVARHEGDSIRLTDRPCPPEVLRHIPEGQRGYFRRANTIVGGKPFTACWIANGPIVFAVYSDGDMGQIPLSQFREEPGV